MTAVRNENQMGELQLLLAQLNGLARAAMAQGVQTRIGTTRKSK